MDSSARRLQEEAGAAQLGCQSATYSLGGLGTESAPYLPAKMGRRGTLR
jgi:hypothetical protein